MAQAVNAFTGTSSHGVPEDYAQRADGVWFTRHYGFNGYAMAMTKWRRVKEDLSDMVRGDILDYGFKPLRRCAHSRLRLPS